MTGGGQLSPAGLLRLAGLVSVAAGVLLVVAQLVGALAFVVVDGDPVRRARSALVGVNGLLTLLAVYLLLLGLVGLCARQAAASGTLGLVGFLVALLARCCWRVPGSWRPSRCRIWRTRRRRWPPSPRRDGCWPAVQCRSASLGWAWVLFGVASVRARVFPRDAALLLVIGGLVGLLIAVVPRRGCPAGAGGGVDGHLAAPVGAWRPSQTAPSAVTLNLPAAAGLGVTATATATGRGDQRVARMPCCEPVHAHGDCLPVSRRAGVTPHPPQRVYDPSAPALAAMARRDHPSGVVPVGA